MVRPGYYRRNMCQSLYKVELRDGVPWTTNISIEGSSPNLYTEFEDWIAPVGQRRAVYYTFERPLEEERNEPMWQVGDQFIYEAEPDILYTITRLEEGFLWVTWSGRMNNNVPFRSPENLLRHATKVNPEPEADAIVEAVQHAVVYMAYTQSRNTNTVTIVSHTDEERFNSMLRAQEGQGFRTLAKKKIKFTL